jgi:hypothetical protein
VATVNLTRALVIGLVASALIVAGYLWFGRAAPLPAVNAPRTEPVPAIRDWPTPTVPSAPRAAPGSPVRAALARAFHDLPLDRTLIGDLEAGEVGAVAAALERGAGAAAAVQLSDLATLCAQVTGAALAETEGAEEHALLLAGGAGAAARAVLAAQLAAARAWRLRFGRGCAVAALDAPRISARLESAAAHGDAASLERAAALDPAPVARLQSAALLGSARAQFRLALAIQPAQPLGARAWLESAARGDADAEAYWGACLLNGCFGAADPPAARDALESAARRGALFALGALSSAEAAGGSRRWSGSDAAVVPLSPRGPEALGLDPAASFAWTAYSAALVRGGCFGFEFGPAAEALDAAARFERTLRPVELEAARAAARTLEASTGAATRSALGC